MISLDFSSASRPVNMTHGLAADEPVREGGIVAVSGVWSCWRVCRSSVVLCGAGDALVRGRERCALSVLLAGAVTAAPLLREGRVAGVSSSMRMTSGLVVPDWLKGLGRGGRALSARVAGAGVSSSMSMNSRLAARGWLKGLGRNRVGLPAICAAETTRAWRRDPTLLSEDSSSIRIGSCLTVAGRGGGSSSITIYSGFDGEGRLNETGRTSLGGFDIVCGSTVDFPLDAPVMLASSATAS